ncbi:preprotein translocase subunit YajC [Kocuria marina]|uniref:preprotein translocase subunit YajC n=1 Tax=Kocuria marina TaxID=223184 RepID=UPI0022E76739|nr:preprotein translocase subunit YajC [Kocuria marina]
MTILAQTQDAAGGGAGTAWFLPVMLVVMVLLLWLPMRRQKKAQAQMKAKQATMEPGTRVMTSFGLYGTLRDMDRENNKAVLEISPGQLVTVHSQTVTTVVDELPAESAATAAPGVVEADSVQAGTPEAAGSAHRVDPIDPVDGSTAAGEQGTTQRGTTQPGTAQSGTTPGAAAPDASHQTWRDARDRDDRGNPTT